MQKIKSTNPYDQRPEWHTRFWNYIEGKASVNRYNSAKGQAVCLDKNLSSDEDQRIASGNECRDDR